MTRSLIATMLCMGMVCALSGCRHKTTVPPLPQITAPVPLDTTTPTANGPMIEPPPAKLPPTPVATAAANPRRERRKAKAASAAPPPAPVQVAAAEPPPEEAAIGALTTGGDASPKSQQEAVDMIAANEKRLNGLSAQVLEGQKAQISMVKNFQRQAQEALNSGDLEGAKTLATKAKLLLDDLTK